MNAGCATAGLRSFPSCAPRSPRSSVASGPRPTTGANYALLIQLVRGALGRSAETRGLPWPNVSSCKFVVTLHGYTQSPEERCGIHEVVRQVPGVLGVVNRM